jgi:hypothetical protein
MLRSMTAAFLSIPARADEWLRYFIGSLKQKTRSLGRVFTKSQGACLIHEEGLCLLFLIPIIASALSV